MCLWQSRRKWIQDSRFFSAKFIKRSKQWLVAIFRREHSWLVSATEKKNQPSETETSLIQQLLHHSSQHCQTPVQIILRRPSPVSQHNHQEKLSAEEAGQSSLIILTQLHQNIFIIITKTVFSNIHISTIKSKNFYIQKKNLLSCPTILRLLASKESFEINIFLKVSTDSSPQMIHHHQEQQELPPERSNLHPDKLFHSSRHFALPSSESSSLYSPTPDTSQPAQLLMQENYCSIRPDLLQNNYAALSDKLQQQQYQLQQQLQKQQLQQQRLSLQPAYQFIEDYENISPRLIQAANLMHHLNTLHRTSLLGNFTKQTLFWTVLFLFQIQVYYQHQQHWLGPVLHQNYMNFSTTVVSCRHHYSRIMMIWWQDLLISQLSTLTLITILILDTRINHQ